MYGPLIVATMAKVNEAPETATISSGSAKSEGKKQSYSNLLLKGEAGAMNVGTNEVVKTVDVERRLEIYKSEGKYYKRTRWIAEDKEKIVEKTFSNCIQKLVENNEARAVQVLPRSVDYNEVNGYTVVMVVQAKE